MGFLITFFLLAIYLFILLSILPYEENIKKYIMKIYSIIYNLIFGFCDIPLLHIFFSNIVQNKINNIYEFLVIYALLLIPINILFKVRGKININKYLIISFLSTLIGIGLYFLIRFITEKLGLYIFI